MVRKIYALFFVCYLFIISGCSKQQDKNIIIEVVFTYEIKEIIAHYIDMNKGNYIYEIYIDKKTEDDYLITLFNLPKVKDYLQQNNPIMCTRINNQIVYVYSGIEDFVFYSNKSKGHEIDYRYKNLKLDFSPFNHKNGDNTLSIVLKNDTAFVAGDMGLPFVDLDFEPPVILDVD